MQSFWNWFIGEAGAAWIVGLLGFLMVLYSFYKSQKPKDGRYVVCKQMKPEFSHLYLSGDAREWVKVEYIGEGQRDPAQIDTLSQVIIDIRLESDTDALNDVELEFHVPMARVLRVWWETAPDYLVEQSRLCSYLVDKSSNKEDKSPDSYWIIQVFLAQLKSYGKYKEDIAIGILADGDLKAIRMPPQGSIGGPVDQVWTAKFVPFKEYVEELGKNEVRVVGLYFLVGMASLLMALIGLLRLIFRVFGPFEVDGWLFVAFFLFGFFAAGLFGFIMQQLRFARRRMSAFGRPQMDRIAGAFSYVMWLIVLLGLILGFVWLIARWALG